ncbi:putative S-adenosylmethionine-dependent methyltransferase [Vitis vinifera]|uniref:Putative S-adenosylmethionine-dependent methyltransferase n=1 Tax=Vitis vinifera TaxID=29760 RepID=A0A438DGW2_VITVI|nr:putative S-adenosylmethionine-dependent methyltransferase [Vitis vinifera]
MSNNREATTQQSFPMKGGDGPHSYVNNSHLQREATDACRTMIEEAIAQKLDVKCFSSNPFRLADLGCSVGPNTFISMQHIVEAVERKYLEQGLKSQIPEFQVFFNDHATNDFNTLFASLPTERRYFACGVPVLSMAGYSRSHLSISCFPLMQSTGSQKVPKELLDKTPLHGTGEGFTTPVPQMKDHSAYHGSSPRWDPASQIPSGVMFDLLGASLMDMTKAGLINEAQVDSFNLPVYAASQEQMTDLECGMHLRAGMEGMIAKHFGSGIIDELFDTFSKKSVEFSHQLESSTREGAQLFAALRRK